MEMGYGQLLWLWLFIAPALAVIVTANMGGAERDHRSASQRDPFKA